MPATAASREIREAILCLQQLTDLFLRRRRALAAAVDLSEAQWRLLEEIAGEDFMPSMFARRQQRAPAAVSRTLRQLLDRELVAVSISPTDARQRVYRLTARGRRTLARLNSERERAIDEVWAPFSRSELREFTRFARTVTDALARYELADR
jgi:DNA-binding MarR family transcriptional regulator